MSFLSERSESSPFSRVVGFAVAAAVVVGVILLAFAWPSITADPKDIPVGVAGSEAQVTQTTQMLSQQAGGVIKAEPYASRDAAVTAIKERKVYGAIVLGTQPTDAPEVLTATAANAQIAQTLQGLGTQLQMQIKTQLQQANPGAPSLTVKVTDIAPYAISDPRGAGMTAASLPLVLGGMIGAIMLSFVITGVGRRAVGLLIYCVVGGLLLGGILQGWFGALQGNYLINSCAIALALAAIAAPIVGMRSLFGLPGMGIGAVFMLLVANPLSGAAMPVEYIVSPWGAIGQWLPAGAASTLIRCLSYFPDANVTFNWLVLAGWVVLGLVLLGLAAMRKKPSTKDAPQPTLAATAV